MKNIVILAGPSGSGLSSAEFVFEELGYYVMKNPPSHSIDRILDDIISYGQFENYCLMLNSGSTSAIVKKCKARKDAHFRYIALNTDADELMKRYSLSRHVHPRSAAYQVSTSEAIKQDIEEVLKIVNEVDLYIDTTSLTVKQLRMRLYKFLEDIEGDKITSVTFISFGIKNGIPQGIDAFFDVRMIPNPYWVEELKELTGADQKVIDYMMSFPVTQETLDNLVKYLSFQLKEVQKSERGSYTIGIACSGGQHRSTFVANYLAEHFAKEYRTQVIHRDSPILNEKSN